MGGHQDHHRGAPDPPAEHCEASGDGVTTPPPAAGGKKRAEAERLTNARRRRREGLERVEPEAHVAQLALVRLLQAEDHQVERRGVVGRKVVVGAVVGGVAGELPHAEIAHAYPKSKRSTRFEILKNELAHLTVDVGVLDVDGPGGLLVVGGGREAGVRGRRGLRGAFGQAGLEHHAATAHAHVLAARVQVGDARRY